MQNNKIHKIGFKVRKWKPPIRRFADFTFDSTRVKFDGTVNKFDEVR